MYQRWTISTYTGTVQWGEGGQEGSWTISTYTGTVQWGEGGQEGSWTISTYTGTVQWGAGYGKLVHCLLFLSLN